MQHNGITQNLPSHIQSEIALEQLNILYKNLLVSIPANFICATVEFISLYPLLDKTIVFSWYIAVIVVSFFRIFTIYYQHSYQNYLLKFYIFIFGTFVSACLWGIAGSYLMPEENLVQQMVTVVMIAGITAGGAQSLQASLIVNMLYMVTIILPLNIWLYMQTGITYLVLAIAMTTYLLFMLISAWRGYKIILNILKLRYENVELVQELSAANHTLIETQTSLRSIQESAPIGMAIVSLDEKFLQVNQALCKITGYTKDELKAFTLKDITHPTDYVKTQERIKNLLIGNPAPIQADRRYLHKNGEFIWVSVSVSLVHNYKGLPQYFISQILDINEEKTNSMIMLELNKKTQNMLAELQLRELEMGIINKMNDMLQTCHQSDEAFSIVNHTAQEIFPDLSGGIIVFNKTLDQMELVKQWGDPQILKNIFESQECWALREGHLYSINDPKKEVLCRHFTSTPEGGTLCLPQIIQTGIIGMLVLIAPQGKSITTYHQQLATSLNDVIRLSLYNIRLRETLREQSIRDPLTGLYNRRYLDEIMPYVCQRMIREKTQLAVAMLDIDFFKRFNDTYGHEAGDEVLKFIGMILKDNFQGMDVACRFGGEEFILILVNSDLNTTLSRLQQVTDKIKNYHISFREHLLPTITISIGVTFSPAHGITPEMLIRAADEALYQAKEKGRDRIEVFSNDIVK